MEPPKSGNGADGFRIAFRASDAAVAAVVPRDGVKIPAARVSKNHVVLSSVTNGINSVDPAATAFYRLRYNRYPSPIDG